MNVAADPGIVSVYAVFADRGEADRVGHIIIEEHLAACVNILGQTESIYRWQGKIETASECAALFKTTGQQAETLVRRIAALHSYENPAITVWSIAHAPLSYTQWVPILYPMGEGTGAMSDQKNVLGRKLQPCSFDPLTGWTRNGCCETDERDHGVHTVCVIVTDEFLQFSMAAGNDLSTPRPEYGFTGLKDGDRWCLCAERWEQARQAGFAPLVVLDATHEKTLKFVALGHLQAHAADAEVL